MQEPVILLITSQTTKENDNMEKSIGQKESVIINCSNPITYHLILNGHLNGYINYIIFQKLRYSWWQIGVSMSILIIQMISQLKLSNLNGVVEFW